MNAQEQDRLEDRLRTVLAAAFPSEVPTDALKQRVQEHAARREEKTLRRARRRRRIGLGLALAGATALVILGVLAWPTLVAAQTLRRMQAAMEGARSYHSITYRLAPGGGRTKSYEVWYQDGKWRFETPHEFRIFTDGKLWQYRQTENLVSVMHAAGPGYYNSSGFTIASVRRDYALWGWKNTIRVFGETQFNGRPAQEILEENHSDFQPSRTISWVDSATDLPMASETRVWMDGREVEHTVSEAHYNDILPASLFVPIFPKTAHMHDMDNEREAWRQQLAIGLQRKRVGDRTIVLRDLQVNAQGDVFLLYTAGKYPDDARNTGNYLGGRDWKIDLTDDAGNQYLWHGGDHFQPYTRSEPPGHGTGYVFNGERLEGDWWTPANPQAQPWKGRTFTVSFHVSPTNIHGGPTDPPVEARYTDGIAFSVAVAAPQCSLLPAYMPYVSGDMDENTIRQEENEARLLGDWDRTSDLADRAQNQEHDLQKALGLYQQMISIEDAIERTTTLHMKGTNTYAWFNVYQILHDLGRQDEARAALVRSRDEALHEDQAMHIPTDKDTHWTQIQKALKLEGIQ